MVNNTKKIESLKVKVIRLCSKRNTHQYHLDQITCLMGEIRDLNPISHDKVSQHILIRPILKAIGYFN